MRAERDRRAAILTAEGEKQSQILTAEGAKQAAVLTRRGRAPGGDPARRGRSQGDRHGLHGDPRGQARPRAAQLRIPADAAAAGRRRRQQGVRHPVGVRAGVRRHRRGARAGRDRGAPEDDPPTAARRRAPRVEAARESRAPGTRSRGRARPSGCENDRGDVRLARRETAGDARRRPPARHADRGGRRRGDARDPPRAARGRRQLQGRQAVHDRSSRSAAWAPTWSASSTPASRSSRSSARS